MQPAYAVLIAVAAAVIAAVLVGLFVRRRSAAWLATGSSDERLLKLEADLLVARDAKADVERRLAVEEERSSRIAALERTLAERAGQAESLTRTKAIVEAQLATSTEGLARVEAALEEVRTRLAVAERSRKGREEPYRRGPGCEGRSRRPDGGGYPRTARETRDNRPNLYTTHCAYRRACP
jgi:hypothetical protein